MSMNMPDPLPNVKLPIIETRLSLIRLLLGPCDCKWAHDEPHIGAKHYSYSDKQLRAMKRELDRRGSK